MNKTEATTWFVRDKQGGCYGPVTCSTLLEWARDGRLGPENELSCDRLQWQTPASMPELELDLLIETAPGRFYGPIHHAAVAGMLADGAITMEMPLYRRTGAPEHGEAHPAEGRAQKAETLLRTTLLELEQLRGEATAWHHAADAAQAQQARLGTTNQRLERESAALREELDALRLEELRLNERCAALTAAEVELHSTCRGLREELQACRSELDAHDAQLRSVRAELRATGERAATAERALSAATARADTLADELEAAQTRWQSTSEELEISRARIATLSEELAAALACPPVEVLPPEPRPPPFASANADSACQQPWSARGRGTSLADLERQARAELERLGSAKLPFFMNKR